MQAFFNFKTKQSLNPLLKVTHFFTNPYMPENQVRLNLASLIGMNNVFISEHKGFVITLFPIEHLIKGNCLINWRDIDSFVINKKIYCKLVDENTIRIDTILYR